MGSPINVFIIDNLAPLRSDLARTLSACADFMVVGEAATGETALEQVQASTADLVLLGLTAQDAAGLQLLQRLKASRPGLSCVALSDSAAAQDLLDALKAGADGYLLKSTNAETLYAGISNAMSGMTVVEDNLKRTLIEAIISHKQNNTQQLPAISLTRREQEILDCLTRQLDARTIASTLGISVSTVKTHIQHLLAKLNLGRRPDAAAWAQIKTLLARTPHINLSTALQAS